MDWLFLLAPTNSDVRTFWMWDNRRTKGAGVREGQGSTGGSINIINLFSVGFYRLKW